uniref:PHD-type domain-containing protein n=1 Tax=Ciona savignyi TaxID=51511 RepID=H2ZAJ8_CIOSA
ASYREVPSLLIHTPHTHLHPDTSSERKRSTSSHSSILSHGVHEETNSHDVYEPPPSRKHSREPPEPSIDFTPTYHKKSKKDKKDREHNRSKSVKKSKHKDKEKKRSTSHERREVKPIVKDKAVEKLVLKKSKFNSPKLHKEREVTSCSFQPERLPLPKLSASIPAPLILNKEKKKEKKEKKKKKEKEMKSFKHVNQTVSHQPKEEITPIPKLTFKMTPSDKKVSIVKKHKRTPSTDDDLNDEDLFPPPPPKKKTPEVKKEPKQVERKLITQTISVDHGVGVVLDADGNRVWICPGCKKPDDGSPMIGCDKCDGWYHWPCVDIVKEPPENEEWFCINCRKAQKQKGKKKQKTKY